MLSVLIPTYCWNTYPLIAELHKQLVAENIPFEIIVIDDASLDTTLLATNEKINSFSNTSFQVLNENIGRSAIRNLLAKKAKFSWLLFLDADVMPCNNKFIKQYVAELSKDISVLIGGLNYTTDVVSKSLRINFGMQREVVSVNVRSAAPYRYFFASNFIIKKTIFNTISFDEQLTRYGYEDLLFANELKENSVFVKHIANPVFHLGIDTNKDFIRKTKEALLNLSQLIITNPSLIDEVKLVRLVKKYSVLVSFLMPFQSVFEKIADIKSSLLFFDLFRITYLLQLLKKGE